MKLGILFIIGLIALTDLCDTVSQLCLKSSINSLDLHINSFRKMLHFITHLVKIPRVWVGFIFSTLSLVAWLFVLSKADLNLAYSLDSMRYILITLASVFVLKERIGIVRWMGIICVVLGIFFVATG